MIKRLRNIYILLLFLSFFQVAMAVEGDKKVWKEEVEGLSYYEEDGINEPSEKMEEIELSDERTGPGEDPRRSTSPSNRRPLPNPSLPTETPAWVSYIAYTLIILVALFLIYLVIRALDPNFTLSKRKKKVVIQSSVFEEDPESLQESEFQHALAEAMGTEDLRLAIRLRFLDTLKHLEEQKIIRWKKSKTNRQYLMEARSHMPVEDLGIMVLMYEQVWFGNFVVNARLYEAFEKLVIKIREGYEK